MKNLAKSIRFWLMILAIVAAAALVISPKTRWIVVTETQLAWPLTKADKVPALGMYPSQRQADRIAKEHPQDVNLQIASALNSYFKNFVWRNPIENQLNAVIARFPNNPMPYAILLEAADINPEHHRRWQYHRQPPEIINGPAPTGRDRTRLIYLEGLTEKGEKLDPNNALWTVMRAAILYNLHQDAAANKVLAQVSGKRYWHTYQNQLVLADIRLMDMAFKHRSSLSNLAIMFGSPFSGTNFGARLRSLARVAIYNNAVVLESEGHLNQGLAIRHALIHLDGLMRAYSHRVIPVLNGCAIGAIATGEPGGEPPAHIPSELKGQKRFDWILNYFMAYLRRIGHPQEAKWASKEIANVHPIGRIVSVALKKDPLIKEGKNLANWWAAGAKLLKTIVFLLIIAIIAGLLCRTRRIQRGEPLSASVYWGMLFGPIVFLVTWLIYSELRGISTFSAVEVWVIFACLITWVVVRFAVRHSRQELKNWLAASAIFPIILAATGFLFYWWLWMKSQDYINLFGSSPKWANRQLPLYIILALLLVGLFIGLLRWRRKIPVSVGLVRGLRSAALPLACLFVLAYGGAVLLTAQREAKFNSLVNEMSRNRCAFDEKLAGQSWSHTP